MEKFLVSEKKDFQRESNKIIRLHKMPSLQIRNLDKQERYQILGNLSIFLVGVFEEYCKSHGNSYSG